MNLEVSTAVTTNVVYIPNCHSECSIIYIAVTLNVEVSTAVTMNVVSIPVTVKW